MFSRVQARWAGATLAILLTLALTAPLASASASLDAEPAAAAAANAQAMELQVEGVPGEGTEPTPDYWSLLFVFVLSSFVGLGVIRRVSRLLHTPLMSITNAISAIAVVGSILVTGEDFPLEIRIMGAIALFASVTNIVSGFLITDRMLKMFKTTDKAHS
jgi:NAD(P) transhydrogenase subunit alpha